MVSILGDYRLATNYPMCRIAMWKTAIGLQQTRQYGLADIIRFISGGCSSRDESGARNGVSNGRFLGNLSLNTTLTRPKKNGREDPRHCYKTNQCDIIVLKHNNYCQITGRLSVGTLERPLPYRRNAPAVG